MSTGSPSPCHPRRSRLHVAVGICRTMMLFKPFKSCLSMYQMDNEKNTVAYMNMYK